MCNMKELFIISQLCVDRTLSRCEIKDLEIFKAYLFIMQHARCAYRQATKKIINNWPFDRPEKSATREQSNIHLSVATIVINNIKSNRDHVHLLRPSYVNTKDKRCTMWLNDNQLQITYILSVNFSVFQADVLFCVFAVKWSVYYI